MQLDLLADVPLREPHRAAGESAGIACLARAEEVADFDSAGAAQFIVDHLAANGATSGEILTNAAISQGFKPHDQRAYGPIFSTLQRRKTIRCVGFVMRAKGHGAPGGRVWELAQ